MEQDKLNIKGRIFDIQKFSIHDGPGIRTIVFLKGCVLRCRWCCNPESQNFDIETMKVGEKNKVIGEDVTVAQVLEEVMKDMTYYKRSGGGLTLSGGESLLQPDFACALLEAARESGINTAIESSGCVGYGIIERYLPHLDLFMLDIKHVDSAKHEAYTGLPNSLILENARKIAESGQNLVIRVPVIPGFNHTPEEIRKIAEFAASLPGVEELHLLPYHRFGQDKYEGLGREYLLGDLETLSEEYMRMLQDAAAETGLQVQIGG
ncbi:glycyl-radical enzyme activating protein [Anaerobium acetethylicum]|nr:glycyl-radical enzyme activating protein [Anaerobium acetethylicum]